MISVMIADDHRVMAEGLAKLIGENPDIQIVGVCSTLEETKSEIGRLKPRVLLLDVALPDGDGIDAIPALRAAHPEMRIIILTMFAEASVVHRAMTAKADGYLFKSAGKEEVERAIMAVSIGETYLCEEAQALLSEQAATPPMLTPREREILRLVAEGHTMKEISDVLCLGFETVHSYMKNLRTKLGCNNTASLVRVAVEGHWI